MPLNNFTTKRLIAHNWRPILDDTAARAALETDLSALLSPRVLEHLPPSFQWDAEADSISEWINARANESEVMCVDRKENGDLVGLLILASEPVGQSARTIHIGYLLSETVWGQGIASELVGGLVSTAKTAGPMRLVGGVDAGNPASARVLQKSGFELAPELLDAAAEMYVLTID